MHHALGELFCELVWRGFLAIEKITAKRQLDERVRFLRQLLRSIPWWREGHILLGLTELELASGAEPTPHGRAVTVIRLSACAALAGERVPMKTAIRARYLMATASFLAKDYADALGQYRGLLALNNLGYLAEPLRSQAFEQAAFSALRVGAEGEAFDFLAQIPEGRLSALGREMWGRFREAQA